MSRSEPACERFETEGLALVESGRELPEHFRTCPECRAAAEAYERLGSALAGLDQDAAPAPGWRDEVWRRIAELPDERSGGGDSPPPASVVSRAERSGSRLPWLATVAAALLAVVGLVLLRPVEPPTPVAPTVSLQIEGSTATHRGGDARPGDRLSIEARFAPDRPGELRLYRNGEDLLLRCPGDPACESVDGVLRGTLALPSPGSYTAALLLEDGSPQAATEAAVEDLDAATERVLGLGGEVILAPSLTVR